MCKFVLMGVGYIGLNNTSYKTAVFDEEIIKLTEKSCPNFLFIGLAGNSDTAEHYYSVLKGIYGDTYGCRTDYLTFSDIKDQAVTKAKIENADIIYVGGGITRNLMRRIRMYGIDDMLAGAREQNKVLCGMSAGAICWCRYGQTKFKNGSRRVRALGFLDLVFCPHVVTQPQRADFLRHLMKTTYKIPAVALDNAALEIVGDKYRVLSLEENAGAFKSYYKRGTYQVENIESVEWKPLSELYSRF